MTTAVCWKDVTGAVSSGTIVEQRALGCHERRAITACPPGECSAPETKSLWPPNPECTRPRTWAAFACACRSTSSAEFTETISGIRAIRPGSFAVWVATISSRGLQSAQR